MFVRVAGPNIPVQVRRYTNWHDFQQGTEDHPYGFDAEDMRRDPSNFGRLTIAKEDGTYFVTRERTEQ